jgi:hypothetical protein
MSGSSEENLANESICWIAIPFNGESNVKIPLTCMGDGSFYLSTIKSYAKLFETMDQWLVKFSDLTQDQYNGKLAALKPSIDEESSLHGENSQDDRNI